MSNFDFKDILSQQQLAKKRLDKILKELTFHNNRNALTGFPIEFMDNYSTVDKDTLVLVLQCNKSVSSDISSYLSSTSDERRRSSMNPDKKISNAEPEEDATPEKIFTDKAVEETNVTTDIETNVSDKKTSATNEADDSQRKEQETISENEYQIEQNQSDVYETDGIIKIDSAKTQEIDDEGHLEKENYTSTITNDHIEKDVSKPVNENIRDGTTDINKDQSNEIDTSKIQNGSNAESTSIPERKQTTEDRDASLINKDTISARKMVEENGNKTAEDQIEFEDSETNEVIREQSPKPKKLMTKIAEEAIEKRKSLNLNDVTNLEGVNATEIQDQADEVKAHENERKNPEKKKKLVLRRKKSANKKQEMFSTNDSKEELDTKDSKTDVNESLLDQEGFKEENHPGIERKEAATFVTKQTVAKDEEDEKDDVNGILSDQNPVDSAITTENESKSFIDENFQLETARMEGTGDSGSERLRQFQPTDYEENIFDSIKILDDVNSGRVSRSTVPSEDSEDVIELTDAERAYINKGKTFHGRQCRRRRIRRIREEEGEYLDTNEVIARIRQKTEALLERQHKLMKRSNYF